MKITQNKFLCCGISIKGRREQNDDAFLLGDTVMGGDGTVQCMLAPPFFAAVADGVSASERGGLASRMSLEHLKETSLRRASAARRAVLKISDFLVDFGIQNGGHANLQTTLCALGISRRNKLMLINVGDSRLYYFRADEIRQLSKDQSFVEMLYENGKITKEQKRLHSSRNIVLSALGTAEQAPNPQITELDRRFETGDVFFLCTDGLSDYVLDSEIETTLALPEPLCKRVERLCLLALNNGSRDNITAVAVSRCE